MNERLSSTERPWEERMGHLAHPALEAACPPVHPHRHLGLTQQREPCPPDILSASV